MKNLLIRLSDNILSKSQMKNVRGGDDYGAGCPAGACIGRKSDCAAGCTKCSTDDNKTYGTCS